MNIPVTGPTQKPGKLHRDFMLEIFRQAMDGLNRSGHDTTLTFDSQLVNQQQ
jgi:hypothetical protein